MTAKNLLWIMCDEVRTDALGCYGSPFAQTPHLDRLAQRSTLFRNATVQSPLCVPSRGSFFTGRWAHSLGLLQNDMQLNMYAPQRAALEAAIAALPAGEWERRVEAQMAEARCYGEEGYTLGVPEASVRANAVELARLQLAAELDVDFQGPRFRLLPEIFADHGYQTAVFGKVHHNAPRTGFQHSSLSEATEMQPFGVSTRWAQDSSGFVMLPLGSILPPVVIGGTCPVPEERCPDVVSTEQAVEFLRTRVQEPWVIHVSIIWPHTPVLPPAPYDELHAPERFAVPPPSAEELRGKSRHENVYRGVFSDPRPMTHEESLRAAAHYHGLMSYTDTLVGRLIDALDASPYADDTAIAFHADHGTLLGEHGLWQKCTFYEPVAKVPLMIAAPGQRTGHVVDGMVQLVDLAPTLLSLCGVQDGERFDGVDLTPQVRGEAESTQRLVFSEVRSFAEGTRRMVSDGEWRLEADVPANPVWGHDLTLYNLREDPKEQRNLAEDPRCREIAQRLLAELQDWTATGPAPDPTPAAAAV
ncbi:MAG TPA: sulfatase-like hydrolase/transferase [Candidatus Dormibacteraeota bacterium]|nr:sulfatase-like hydrolase/transferase [Candidatus Dormibacteraeota bacterium]